jgi:hypothetical protein
MGIQWLLKMNPSPDLMFNSWPMTAIASASGCRRWIR